MAGKPKKPTYCALVWWLDAHFDSGEVDPKKSARAYDKISCGMLIQDDEKGVRVAQDWNEDGSAEAVTFVPRGMISRMRKFKIPQ